MRLRLVLLLVAGIGCSMNGVAANTEYTIENYRKWVNNDVAPPTNNTFLKECGDCHVAFPPGLLPTRSWEWIVNNLEDHFGEKLDYKKKVLDEIRDYVMENSADDSEYKRSRMIMESLQPLDVPKRITDVPHIKRKHRLLLQAYINPTNKPRSLANCDTCHPRAIEGIFDESEVKTVWEKPKNKSKGKDETKP